MHIAAVIPAAGYSSRMGCSKPLLSLGHSTVLGCCIHAFQQKNITEHIVVTGNNADAIAQEATRHGAATAYNAAFDDGMFSSIRTGVKALSPHVSHFFVLPVDIPLVRPETIRHLLHIVQTYTDHILYPTFHNERGHPPLIPCSLRSEILQHDGSGGLRNLLDTHEDMAIDIPVADRNILNDLDYVHEYAEAKANCLREFPTQEECHALWDIYAVPEKVRQHCNAVATLSTAMCRALAKSGIPLNTALAHSAALVHDIAKGHKHHARVGAAWLCEHGFPKAATIVEAHSHIAFTSQNQLTETIIVFLADKVVQGTQPTTIEKRYTQTSAKHGTTQEIASIIQKKKDHALCAQHMFEQAAHCSLTDLADRVLS